MKLAGEPDDGGSVPPVPATIGSQLVSTTERSLLAYVSTSAANRYELAQVFLRLSRRRRRRRRHLLHAAQQLDLPPRYTSLSILNRHSRSVASYSIIPSSIE